VKYYCGQKLLFVDLQMLQEESFAADAMGLEVWWVFDPDQSQHKFFAADWANWEVVNLIDLQARLVFV
jgi:hypothetical protein